MKQKTGLQQIPNRRSGRTIRVVIQAFDPIANRYRDRKSIRLEAAAGIHLDSEIKRLEATISKSLEEAS
jgi:hypothetical protein